MPPKRPLAVSSSSKTNIEDEEIQLNTKKRLLEHKENISRKKLANDKKTSSTLTGMYDNDDEDDELEDILPKKVRKPSKPKATAALSKPNLAKPEESKPKKSKPRSPSPDSITEESSVNSIGLEEIENEPTETSIEEEPSIINKRGRPKKSTTPSTQPARARSVSAQPSVHVTPNTSMPKPARGRKPKLEVVPETQQDVDELDEVAKVGARSRQGSLLPASIPRKPSYERPAKSTKGDRVKELQTQTERNFTLYKERAETRFKATDELVASLTAELKAQKESVQPSQLKYLESKVKRLQEELQHANEALTTAASENTVLTARLQNRSTDFKAHLREELHSDLSGLIFRNVEQGNGMTTFDCLQTGRNGTLHYKLALEDKEVNNPHGQILYTPMLDEKRDEKLLQVLPDYLTDEIMFAREQASLFYWRLNQYLQKKVE